MYYRVHEALAEKIPSPDIIVYLYADLDVLMQRISQRDRTYERNIERGYIEQLAQAYDAYFAQRQGEIASRKVPVLVIDTNHLDYVRHPDDLSKVEYRIRQALKLPPFQEELPLPPWSNLRGCQGVNHAHNS
jgi:deoxyguanosine kinase